MRIGSRLKLHTAAAIVACSALFLGAQQPLAAQDRLLTSSDRPYFDARFSPDGRWVSAQANGSLRVMTSAGANETVAFSAGRAISYLWESNSVSMLVTTGTQLLRVSRDGLTQRQVANLAGQNVLDIYAAVGNYAICTRRSGIGNVVSRIDLTTGKLEDIVTGVPGVTSIDVDATGTSMVLSNTVFLFQYNFYRAGIDGKGLSLITGSPLNSLAQNARWLEGTQSCVIEHVGMISGFGGGFQMWRMDASNGNLAPLTWQPRYRRGAPAVSPDGKWLATHEILASGEVRAVVLPALGGGEFVLSPALKNSDSQIAFSPNSDAVVYTGTDDAMRKGGLRIFEFARPLQLTPATRLGTTRQYSLPLANGEAGLVFFGIAATRTLAIPGLTGELGLALAPIAPTVLASGANTDVKGVFVTPSTQALVGVEVALQGLRLEIGMGLKGAWDNVAHVTILP